VSEISDWSQTNSVNNDASPDGWPEDMARSGVNDSAREGMAVIRRFYENPEWNNLLTEKGDTFTVTVVAGDVVATSPGVSSAAAKYPDGSRVRLTGGALQLGFVNGVPTYNGTDETTFVIAVDGGDPVDSATDQMDIVIFRDTIGRAAYSPVGVTLAQDPPFIPSIDDLGTAALLDNGAVDAATLETVDLAGVVALASSGTTNFVQNPAFAVWQRGLTIDSTTTFPNDANGYCADRWRLLSGIGSFQLDDIVVASRDTSDVPDGFWSSIKLLGANLSLTPNAERSGVFQILEGRDSQDLVNSAVSFSYWAKVTGGGVLNTRGMILKWVGVEDVMPANPISDWQSAGDATGPTFSGSWEKVMDTQQVPTDGTWTRYTQNVQGIDLSTHTNAKNFAIFLYADDESMANGDTVMFTGAQLEIATVSSGFRNQGYSAELARCQRYFTKTFDRDVSPVDNTSLKGAVAAVNTGSTALVFMWRYSSVMRVAPTIAQYNPSFVTANQITRLFTPVSGSFTITQTDTGTSSHMHIGTSSTSNNYWAIHYTADAEL